MSERVRDPYDYFFGEVLRLPPGAGDPDHYTILGLPFFERDAEKIRAAGHEQKERIRAAPAGDARFEHVREEMLERIRESRRTLLTPEAREAYDAFLIGEPGSAAPPEDPDFALAEGIEFAERYRILREERKGGFGRIYSVLDSQEGRRCELTVLPPHASHDPGRRRRAERALRRLNELRHPAIANATVVGEAEGLLFARWAAPDGFGLLRYVDRQPHGRVEPIEAARIADGIASALAHAHSRGVIHGDLHPRSVFVDSEGNVHLTEVGLAAGAQPPKQLPRSPYTAPERALNEAADRYSLGAVVYFMLCGEAPFLDGGRGLVPKPLPDSVPIEFATTVLGLLGREPTRRPAQPRFSSGKSGSPGLRRRIPLLAAVAVLIVVVAVAIALGGSGGSDGAGADSAAGRAWKLIEERRFTEAIKILEPSEGRDKAVAAPLASALEGHADERERAGDPYAAQNMLERAQRLVHDNGRATQLERVRKQTKQLLESVNVSAPAVAAAPVVSVRVDGAQVDELTLNGEPAVVGRNPLTLPEGDHTIAYVLVDRAGNRREGTVALAVDRTAPKIEILAPADGTFLQDGAIDVRVRIVDEHAGGALTIHGREVTAKDGSGGAKLNLPNGRHEIVVEAADRAGNPARHSVTVTVDDSAPELVVEAQRVVTRDGNLTIRGKGSGKGVSVEIDGKPVDLDSAGAFEQAISITGDRAVEIVATSATGAVSKATVQAVLDTDLPRVELDWTRRGPKGRFLYGSSEMDAGVVAIPVRVRDRTKVQYTPSEGTVADGVWKLAPHQGEREVTLTVSDEANNRQVVRAVIAGHRATPKLTVETSLARRTRDVKGALEIESDKPLFLNGKPIEAGRIPVALPEGKVELHVQAIDLYGNVTEWKRTVIVDRTPPELKVVGAEERGVGTQPIVIEADEDLESITALSQTRARPGRTASFTSFLEPGREHIHVVARDLVGNVRKTKLKLRVVNRVMMFDGKSALTVPMPAHLANFTVEFWARGAPAVDPSVFVTRGAHSGYQVVWASADEALPHALLYLESSGVAPIVGKKALRNPTDWHHYALVHEGRKIRFFIDGKQQGYLDRNEKLTRGGAKLVIGCGGLSPEGNVLDGFIGRIDELRISEGGRYGRAFSPQRFLRADEKTQLLLRFDLAVGGRYPDSSSDNRKTTTVGEPKLIAAEE